MFVASIVQVARNKHGIKKLQDESRKLKKKNKNKNEAVLKLSW